MNRFTLLLITLTCLGLSGPISAQGFTPTAAQIQQFQSLSPEQQQEMAEAAGIDLKSFNLGGSNSSQPDLSEKNVQRPREELTQDIADDLKKKKGKKDGESERDEESEDDASDEPDELRLFGRDLFKSNLDAFRPASDIPVPADYTLGPGDTIVIQLYGKESSSHALVVNREGQIQFPRIGPVTLAGLTFSETQALINNIVDEQLIGVRASVTMGALRSIRIFVLGEVERPGSFIVGSLSTMTNGLFLSGGITDVGSLRNVQLKRRGEVVTTLDLYDLLLSGDTSADARLRPGDVIFVPPLGATVGISGEIKRPAIYEIRPRAQVEDLISLAGGLKNTAYLPSSYLVRHDDDGESTLLNLDLSKKDGLQRALQDGDRLTIASKLDFINNQVTVVGHTKRSGPRSWRPGLRFTDLVPSARHLLPNPDIEVGLIQRFSVQTRRVDVILFSPKEAWEAPGSSADPLLQGHDLVHIFDYEEPRAEQLEEVVEQLESQARFKERRKIVSVSGSVRFPGTYPLAKGMTTDELIQLAGGLTESALDTNGEITRYDIDDNRQRLVMHINIDFSGKAVELEPGDTLQVKQIPLWKNKETVELLGEVMFPGTYTILPGETLVDVLTRAGGMTPHAYPLGAIFSRQELRDLEQQRLAELRGKLQSDIAATSATGPTLGQESVDASDAEELIRTLDSVKPLGRMVINLPRILHAPAQHDFQLEDGDTLNIPRYKPSVTVVGEVQYPTSHFFDETLDAIAYIEHSGGYKKHADEARVYIVRANGSVTQPQTSAWFKAREDAIQPGDTIVVPLETDRIDKLTVWAKATQIIYQAALGAAAVGGL